MEVDLTKYAPFSHSQKLPELLAFLASPMLTVHFILELSVGTYYSFKVSRP